MARRSPEETPVSKVARMLALAHHIERLIEQGELACIADAARALGLTRARMTQVMNLMLLSPEIQARVLLGEIAATEHDLRRVVKEADWRTQSEALDSKESSQDHTHGDYAWKRISE